MASSGLSGPVVSAGISALAGATIYHLVAITLKRQRLKRGLLLELSRNYRTLQGEEDIVQHSDWDEKLHNRYRTQVFDSITVTSPKIWNIDETDELIEVYDRLAYLNDLQSASLIGKQSLDRGPTVDNIQQAQEDIEDVFPDLKRRWYPIDRYVQLND